MGGEGVVEEVVGEVHRYDRWFDAGWGAYVFAVERDTLVTVLGDLQGQRLAEVGCGTGRLTAALETAGAEVIGIDRDHAHDCTGADPAAAAAW